MKFTVLLLSALALAEDMPLEGNHPAMGYLPDGFVPPPRGRARHSEAEKRDISRHIERLSRHFKKDIETNVDKLPSSYMMPAAPWPGDYWPVYKDGINRRWDPAQDSAVTKYAKAFGLDPKKTADEISRTSGIDAHPSSRACTSDYECADLNDGSRCAIRDGKTRGRCIPTWFGICHAWAPAAIMEPEGKCAVKVKDVSFGVNDIKALMSQMYDKAGVNTIFTGNRCYEDEPDTDANGRYVDWGCRDLAPDFFHIAVTNVLGRFKTSFVVDVDAAAPVWNQPTRAYQVREVRDVSVQEANRYFEASRGSDVWAFSKNVTSLVAVTTSFYYIVEAYNIDLPLVTSDYLNRYTVRKDYQYILELDAKRNIVGGEWIGKSKEDHPDFLYFATELPSADHSVAGITYGKVKKLLEASTKCKPFKDDDEPTEEPPTAPPAEAPTPSDPVPPSATEVPVITPTPTSRCNRKHKWSQWLCEHGLLPPRKYRPGAPKWVNALSG